MAKELRATNDADYKKLEPSNSRHLKSYHQRDRGKAQC